MPLAAGETQSKVLLESSRVDTLAVASDCRRSSEGGLNVAATRLSPREPQLDAATMLGATREPHRAEGGLAVATNQGATLRSHRRWEGGIDVASRQARDRQVQYLNAQQARLESEVEREFLSGSTGASSLSRQALTDASDLAPVKIGTPGSSPSDIDSMLMIISISGSANLQHRIRQLCHKYSDNTPLSGTHRFWCSSCP